MEKIKLDNIYEYLHSFENSKAINNDTILLSRKIENFCFQCHKDKEFQQNILFLKNKHHICENEIEYSKCYVKNNIDYNACNYIDHDIFNKYLYLLDYLKKSYDKNKALDYLNDFLINNAFTVESLSYLCNLDSILFYKILNSETEITKYIALKICIGLNFNYEETLDFLLQFGYTLSMLNKNDCIARYCIENKLSISNLEYLLNELN